MSSLYVIHDHFKRRLGKNSLMVPINYYCASLKVLNIRLRLERRKFYKKKWRERQVKVCYLIGKHLIAIACRHIMVLHLIASSNLKPTKQGAILSYRLVLGCLLWECSHPRALPYTNWLHPLWDVPTWNQKLP